MLSFLNRQIKMDSSEDAELVVKAIDGCRNMKALELRGNTLGIEAGKRIAQALEGHPELEKCLWSDLFTGRLKTEIPIILKTLCSAMINARCYITELDLSDNAFGPVGAEGISQFLMSSSAYSLQVLKLNNNGLGAGGKTIAKCLLECHRSALRDSSKFELKTFIAGRNRLEDSGASALAEAFSVLGSLEEINLAQNGIREKGVCALAKSFKSNPFLRIINMNDNTCTVEGALALAESICHLTKLKILDLGDSLCRNEGIMSILHAVSDSNHKALEYVDFSGNELSAEVAIIVIQKWKEAFLTINQDVKLKISNNCFGSQFQDVRDAAENTVVYVGEEEDDEGSISSTAEHYESTYRSEEYSSDGQMNKDLDNEEKSTINDGVMDNLLSNIQHMNVTESDMKGHEDDVVSFLDQQLKLSSLQDAELVAQTIEQRLYVRVLELRGNSLGIESGERIAQAIKFHPELQRCLWSDLFTGRLKNEIPPILKSLCSAMILAGCRITELDLSDNAFGPLGAEGIREFLLSPAAYSLEVLKLNNNGLGEGGKVIAECLSECHRKSVQSGRPLRLKTFMAGRNRLEVQGAIAFATAFTQIGTLEELFMPQNGITFEGIEALAMCFSSNLNLRVVNLNDNTVTERGSCAIAKALPSMLKLEVLNLGDCLCRDQGCHSIVDSLSPAIHSSLREVDLSGSELSGAAAIQIAGKWRKFATASLILASNNLGHSFKLIRDLAVKNIDIGDSSDDQGSVSTCDEELRSASDSSDEQFCETSSNMIEDSQSQDAKAFVKSCEESLEKVQDQFESATQEEAARLLLKLADIITRSEGNKEVIEMAYNVAQNVLCRVQAVRRRPISATSQLINNLVAQAGFVKCEEKWDIPVNNASLSLLLNHLVDRGYFSDQLDVIRKYFGDPV